MNTRNETAKVVDLPFRGRRVLPAWAEHTLQSIDRETYSELKRFLVKRHSANKSVVVLRDVNRFVSRDDGSELSWKALLRLCRKRHAAEARMWNPDYWLDPTIDKQLSFVIVGGNTLIYKGVYKTAAARIALDRRNVDTLYGVRVARWGIDWEAYDVWKKLDRLCRERYPHLTVEPRRKLIQVEERGNWKIESYFLTLKRTDKRTGREETLNLQEAKDWIARTDSGKTQGLISLFQRRNGSAAA